MLYRIAIQGPGDKIQKVFSDLTIERDGELTILTGPVIDQSQLQGILAMIGGLDLPLVSFAPIDHS